MSSFQLVFTVFNLLLGLAVAEVLRGFAKALKIRRGGQKIRVGWLTPLLGLYFILDVAGFWMKAWEAQGSVHASYATLITVLFIVGVYYLVATLIFPDDPNEWPDFDDWYDRESRLVIGGMIFTNIALSIGQLAAEIASRTAATMADDREYGGLDMVESLAGLALLVALLKVKDRRAKTAILIGLIIISIHSGVRGNF